MLAACQSARQTARPVVPVVSVVPVVPVIAVVFSKRGCCR